MEAKIQASANAGTTGPCPRAMSASEDGMSGFHAEIAQAETMPAPARKTSVWLMYRRWVGRSDRGRK